MADSKRDVITIAEVDRERSKDRVGVRTADGRWFGVFDQKLWPKLNVGASLNVEWITAGDKGQFRNIVGILGIAHSENGSHPTSDRERNIIRESALRAACQLYSPQNMADGNVQSDLTVDWVLHVADRFAVWISQEGEEAPF